MRKIATILLVFLPFIGVSQYLEESETLLNYQEIDHKFFHFGYTLGINTMDFGIYPSENAFSETQNDTFPELNKLAPGIDIGIITNFRLSEYWDFRFLPGISLGQRNLLYYDSDEKPFSEMILGSTFINLPFIIRYEAKRQNNFRPYLVSGVNFRWDMARNKDFNSAEDIYVKLEPFDVYFEGGVGVDFYLTYFKLSTELKFSVGNFNVLSPDKHDNHPGFVSSIDQLKSRMVSLSFHFE
ncbi:MAG: outer membrane beta-barrel protein, partial [Bacteroidota bacterium]